MIKLIYGTDIYIHSSFAETLSTSLLQVMACKVPIIATDIPGINNLLLNEEDAILFTPNNITELIDKIFQLILDNDLKEKIIENSYSKVMLQYNNTLILQKYLDFLKK